MTDTQPDDPATRRPFYGGSPTSINVVPWPDPLLDSCGHKPGSPYIHGTWLGVLGPTTTLAWERLSRIAVNRPGTAIDVIDLAKSLGLGSSLGRNAAITRTLDRMVNFGAATRVGNTLAVRPALPDVPERIVKHLSYTAQMAHRRWASAQAPAAAAELVESRPIGLGW